MRIQIRITSTYLQYRYFIHMIALNACSLPTTSEDLSLLKIKPESRSDRANRRSEIKNQRIKVLSDLNTGKNLTGHWTFEESTKYLIFLIIYQENFQKKSLRRSQKIFKEMSKLLKTRTADQCRSHHQKMQKKCLSFDRILAYLQNCYPMEAQYRDSLENQCLRLKNQISDGDKHIQKEENGQISRQMDNQEKEVDNEHVQMFEDMSVFKQNGYYVMPVFIIPCSEFMFYNVSLKQFQGDTKSFSSED